jgi:hypothetical protein
MKILNYKWHTFSMFTDQNFFVAYFTFIDYNGQFREVCISRQLLWREYVYVAQFSWFTTEYTWNLKDVLDKVIKHYQQNETNK